MNFPDDFISTVQTVSAAAMSSTTFALLVAFLGLYCLVLFADIVLLFILRPIGGDLKKGMFGTKERPLASARSRKREWSAIEARLASNAPSEYKVAVLEADNFTDKMLAEMGYEGADLGGRLTAIPPGHFAKLDALREAHEIRNRIVLDHEYTPDRVEATRVLKLYHAFLDEAELFL